MLAACAGDSVSRSSIVVKLGTDGIPPRVYFLNLPPRPRELPPGAPPPAMLSLCSGCRRGYRVWRFVVGLENGRQQFCAERSPEPLNLDVEKYVGI